MHTDPKSSKEVYNKPMKILLVSPLDPPVPQKLKYLMGGENTYTRTLLQHPPPGVTFIHFEKALELKLVSYHPLQYLFVWLQKLRILPLGPRVIMLRLHHRFDLVYAHVHPVRVFGAKIPVAISDSSSNTVFLRYYIKWPLWWIKSSEVIQQYLFNFFSIVDSEVGVGRARAAFVFSHWAAKIKRRLGWQNFKIIYPGLPGPVRSRPPAGRIVDLLFVGIWFERKGGRLVVKVFRRLLRKYPRIHLTLIGPLPVDIHIAPQEPITQINYVNYSRVLDLYRQCQILVHVPPRIEGYGIVVPEAMSFGLCPVVSDVCALPEMVESGKSGLVVRAGSEADLEKKLKLLLKDSRLRKKLGQQARVRFRQKFSLPLFHRELKRIFTEALR